MTEPRILGLDPSLKSFGVCYPDGSTRTLEPPEKWPNVRKVGFHQQHLGAILDEVKPQIVALEDYTRQRNSASTIQLAELGGVVRLLLHQKGYRCAFINPSTLKSYVTGKRAKEELTKAITDHANRTFPTSDEADAWALAGMASDAYGFPWYRVPDKQRQALKKVKWPALGY